MPRDGGRPDDEVSRRLGEQAQGALSELLRGFEAADAVGKGRPFARALADDPAHVHDGLLATLLRLVVLLHAEERGLFAARPTGDLYEELRAQRSCDRAEVDRSFGAWPRLLRLFRLVHRGGTDGPWQVRPHGGRLFDADAYPFLEGRPRGSVGDDAGERSPPAVSDGTVLRVLERLIRRDAERGSLPAPGVERIGNLYEVSMGYTVAPSAGGATLAPTERRRRSGSHYTPRALAERVVDGTCRPLFAGLGPSPAPASILELTVCDPAMGSGAFLLAACRWLGDRLVEAWQRHGLPDGAGVRASRDDLARLARRLVAQRCLYGVDENPFAVELAKVSLWLVTGAKDEPFTFLDHALRHGDSLVGVARREIATGRVGSVSRERLEQGIERARGLRARLQDLAGPARAAEAAWARAEADEALAPARATGDAIVDASFDGRGGAPGRAPPFHWDVELPEVFAGAAPGFAALMGNPPWVSFVGRAAQPLAEPLKRWFVERYASFAGYRNLQGLFVERCAALLRPGGRMGIILPSSMSEQEGYAPTRLAHDRLCACDPDLPDLGEEGFLGVFQPSMVLCSTRLAAPRVLAAPEPWPIERPDLDDGARRLMAKMSGPPLPPHLFGERGLQSSGDDVLHLSPAPDEVHTVALRAGGDVEPFRRKPPSNHADPRWFGSRLRPAADWQSVRLLIRQTARVPMAALSDGLGFRNSVLAGFEDADHPAAFLCAYLDSTPIRWLHYVRHRDARQGMPQLKIGHLRETPAPPKAALVGELAALGEAWSARNAGVDAAEQARLDELVADAFDLSAEERARLRAWWAALR
jgi:hypothetical protein